MIKKLLFIAVVFFSLISCRGIGSDRNEPTNSRITNPDFSIAFMADVHFHDVYADFLDGSFSGIEPAHPDHGNLATIRTMYSQLTSTRLFNENYFAFRAGLDKIVNRGIKLVVLTGDFSDDGQPVHLRGLKEILDEYQNKHGLRFFLITGNHDPNRPYTQEAGKGNYLGAGGKQQPVYSLNHPRCESKNQNPEQDAFDHSVICTDEVIEYGYRDILSVVGNYGFYPDSSDQYFETPFSSYSYEEYNFEIATAEAELDARAHEICHEGTGGRWKGLNYNSCFYVPDVSYLVEPVDGLWLLALDANVLIPRMGADTSRAKDPGNFYGSGNAGFNAVVSHKEYLLEWAENVTKKAKVMGKTVVVFSHYPMADFYNGAQQVIEGLWGEGRFQLERVPSNETEGRLADTGMNIHFGGHMHMNDTNTITGPKTGNKLINIQSPSIAGYVPAFKLFYYSESERIAEIETVLLDDVPEFDSFFEHYNMEWEYLNRSNQDNIWNREILNSTSYREFTDWHMKELSRLRFMPREWPDDLRTLLRYAEGDDLHILAQLNLEKNYLELVEAISSEDIKLSEFFSLYYLKEWEHAKIVQGQSEGANFAITGEQLGIDLYRLRNSGSLAYRDIPSQRLNVYRQMGEVFRLNAEQIQKRSTGIELEKLNFSEGVNLRLALLFEALNRFSGGYPDDHFLIHTESGLITNLKSAES